MTAVTSLLATRLRNELPALTWTAAESANRCERVSETVSRWGRARVSVTVSRWGRALVSVTVSRWGRAQRRQGR